MSVLPHKSKTAIDIEKPKKTPREAHIGMDTVCQIWANFIEQLSRKSLLYTDRQTDRQTDRRKANGNSPAAIYSFGMMGVGTTTTRCTWKPRGAGH